jgi:hypothetical protein
MSAAYKNVVGGKLNFKGAKKSVPKQGNPNSASKSGNSLSSLINNSSTGTNTDASRKRKSDDDNQNDANETEKKVPAPHVIKKTKTELQFEAMQAERVCCYFNFK